MASGAVILLILVVATLLAAVVCLRLACRWGKADVPSFGASLGWVLVIGGAVNGPAAIMRNYVIPRMDGDPRAILLAVQAASCLTIPFLVIRLFICEETFTALRVHLLYLLLGGLLVGGLVAVVQLLR